MTCFRFFSQTGICITQSIFEKYSPELRQAWCVFAYWWVEALEKTNGEPINPLDVPENVISAMGLIEATPIPTYGDVKGDQSCLVKNVRRYLITPM